MFSSIQDNQLDFYLKLKWRKKSEKDLYDRRDDSNASDLNNRDIIFFEKSL